MVEHNFCGQGNLAKLMKHYLLSILNSFFFQLMNNKQQTYQNLNYNPSDQIKN